MAGFNLKAAIDAAKNKGPDMTQAQKGGGYELPVEGFTRLRLVGYIELGKRESEYKGVKKIKDQAELVFELSGPKHEPRDTDSGKIPHRVTKKINLSQNENSTSFKLFTAMNWEGKYTHFAEMLGNDFVAKIKHNKVGDATFVNVEDIARPFGVNPETGDEYRINVASPLTELKLFLWDFASPEMWDALFIPGEYEEQKDAAGKVTRPARSKNVIQEKIRKAVNVKASPIYDYMFKNVTAEDAAALDEAVGEAEEAPRAAGADDLEGVV